MDLARIFGGNPLAVILRLVVISVIVGVALSALDIRPQNLVDHVRLLAQRLWAMGFGLVEGLFGYLLVGAVVVVPIWLVVRLVAGLGRRDH